MRLSSQVILTSDIQKSVEKLEALVSNEQIIKIIKEDNFLVEDAKLAIEKSYMASENTTILLLGAKSFSPIVQNKLLKVIEEPPKNKVFILLTQSKSTILDTIRSRLPLTIEDEESEAIDIGLDLANLSLATVYMFIQQHKRTDAKTMKILIEHIGKEAIKSQAYKLDQTTLRLLSSAYIALDMGSPPSFILNTVLLKLLARKKR